mgnify:CR=1 FL=1
MDLDAQMEAARKSVEQQLELSAKSLNNAYDAADRLMTLKAVDATIRLAQTPVKLSDPTT